jgi:MerR family mercuric resistance operon transcriptional regulator
VEPEISCDEVRYQALTKMRDVDKKIRDLKHMRNALSNLIASCQDKGPIGDCPILEALEEENFNILINSKP